MQSIDVLDVAVSRVSNKIQLCTLGMHDELGERALEIISTTGEANGKAGMEVNFAHAQKVKFSCTN